MIVTDCFKGLIGFSRGNACLDVIPPSMQGSRSGLYMDEHPAYLNAIVRTAGIGQMWAYIQKADEEARLELLKLLLIQIRTKVEPGVPIRTVAIGEETGTGYYTDFSQPAFLTVPTMNSPDAVYVLTHIGIKATLLAGPQTVTVTLKKNGTVLTVWQLTITNNSATRYVLPTAQEMPLDGSVYVFEYSFTAQMLPSRNAMDCGCDTVRAGYSCFFKPFTGDAGGLRLLGEIRCQELLWPCGAVSGGLAGIAGATVYRALLLNFLFRQLQSDRAGQINAYTLLKGDELGPMIQGLAAEIESGLGDFAGAWEPGGSCCYSAKTRMGKFT